MQEPAGYRSAETCIILASTRYAISYGYLLASYFLPLPTHTSLYYVNGWVCGRNKWLFNQLSPAVIALAGPKVASYTKYYSSDPFATRNLAGFIHICRSVQLVRHWLAKRPRKVLYYKWKILDFCQKKKRRKTKKQGGKTPLSVFELEPHGAGVCLWLIYDSVDK